MEQGKWNFNNSYAKLPKIFYTNQSPTTVRAPKLIIFNHPLASSLGVPLDLNVFAGNEIPKGAEPLAQAYAGHQFGYFTMLGDGRAILLGEQITDSGERFDIQLKGSGRTPYSRGGDGRAALGPMLREYIISEAMHELGIPTTRSLAVVTTGETITREENLPGAVLTRVSASHIRVGTFEYASRFGTSEDVRCLADYTITRHFPSIATFENKYLQLLREVIKRQASLISKWQLVGFIHGVMNTDNMAISGETIDYGPCAFMDVYDPTTVFSSIDTHGRYSYENQPKMAVWNLARFAETLLPFLHDDKNKAVSLAQEELAKFESLYQEHWLSGMRAKLGLYHNEVEDLSLIKDILQLMQQYKADYTKTFQSLTFDKNDGQILFSSPDYHHWHERWQARLSRQSNSKDESKELMKSHNPAIIPRNHRVEEALAAANEGDLSKMHKLLDALKNPYRYTPEQEEFSTLPAPESCHYKTFCGT
ncbi:protein adenylyltransferase SelO [Lacrimispora aerotolerans]|uniref:protein adenylyltransferase SelO n=1 Tax=Lacrimispora aerotolerans TaxID=36832 RepID=UPI00047B58ED|nr:YdiU family protein [Lacrimispora aerotolerans]